jgi:hypothetical protein
MGKKFFSSLLPDGSPIKWVARQGEFFSVHGLEIKSPEREAYRLPAATSEVINPDISIFTP